MMRIPRSLQGRLALGLGLGLSAIWLLASLAAVLIIRHEMDEVFDSALQETAQRLLPLAVMGILDRSSPETATQRIASVRPQGELLTYVVRGDDGATLLTSHDADPEAFPVDAPVGFSQTGRHRIYAETALQGTVTVLIAQPLGFRTHSANEASLAVATPLVALVPLSLLGVWGLVRKELRPLRNLSRGIEARGSGDLSPLSPGRLPSEIEPVVEAVNQLLDRLRRALEAERGFAAHSAHELRTPIAAALAQTQRLITETADGPLGERARQVESSLHGLARIGEKLMQLAKAEGGRVVADHPQDIVPILSMVVGDAAKVLGAIGRIHLHLLREEFVTDMDPDAFAIMTRNLIENALKHGAEDHAVLVSLDRDGTLTVDNRGPVLSQDDLRRLTEPFERGAATASGHGLGLAIVAAIAKGAGAVLDLSSPAPGQPDGFRARVALPKPGSRR